MNNLTYFILPEFADHGEKSIADPAHRYILLGNIGPWIKPIGFGENFLRFLKPDPAIRIRNSGSCFSEDQT